ncbi:hypothetical protein [Paenibacillus sp. MMO-58]|uniref:hypothetical protein n=1 Tax=Paenibacillus sp. MMO-58 TaxID=3081290 RepID=UPI00301B3CCC
MPIKIVIGDCDRCGEQAECVQLVVKEFAESPHYEGYEDSNVCASCIGNMLAHEDQF